MSTIDSSSDKDDEQSGFNFNGEVTDTDLTAFQQNMLFAIRGCEEGRYDGRAPKGAMGLAIKEILESEAYYDEEVNHGRLYPNLDQLVEKGLLAKSELDKRTNQYTLTDDGLEVIAKKLQREIAAFKGEPEGGDA